MKFHPSFDTALARLVASDPAAVVVITYSASQPAWQAQLERRLALAVAQRAVAAHLHAAAATSAAASAAATSARVRFLPSLEHGAFLSLLRCADVVLDPWPFGGGVTSLEALSLGVPVVTLPSRQSVVQLAAGFYQRMSDRRADRPGSSDSNSSHGVGNRDNSDSAAQDPAAWNDPPWPVAANEDEFVALAVAIAASTDAERTGSASAGPGAQKLGLRAALKRRILARHGVLYEDESAAEEWTRLLVRLRASASAL
jgi:hypothetical protein